MNILLGYTTTRRDEAPVVVYCGNSGSEALKAAAASTFPRLEMLTNPPARKVRGWTEERAAAHAEAQDEGGSVELTAPVDLRANLAQIEELEQKATRLELDLTAANLTISELREKLAKLSEAQPLTTSAPAGTTLHAAAAAPTEPVLSNDGPALIGTDDGPSLLVPEPEAPARKGRR